MKYNSDVLKGIEEALFSLHPKAEALYRAAIVIRDMNHRVKQKGDNELLAYGFAYNKFSPVTDKILFCLRHLNQFVRVHDIKWMIIAYEPEFKKGLSTALTKLKNEGKIVIIKPSGSNREAYYGYHSWVDEKNNPLPEYMYS